MDRDQRWERVRPAYLAITQAQAEQRAASSMLALESAYARGENDEFVAPTVIGAGARVADGDAVVFMNFRADRAREITSAFVLAEFSGFERPRRLALGRFSCLSEYDANLPAPVAFGADDLHNTLADVVSAHGLSQLRIAETEKYAHVTFFLSGGREAPVKGEDRILIPSPKVATYDLQPEMSCPELTEKLVDDIRAQRHDLIVCNIANPDMVGHTGSLPAAIAAAEAVDVALGALRAVLGEVGGEMLVTADHGNLEMMRDPSTGQAHTAHTVGPVPIVYFGKRAAKLRSGGALRDIAPTLLDLLGIAVPAEMTGRTLLEPR
jgi:2,3-bisphosphoglycerate-independent phosphoglycerate mutase